MEISVTAAKAQLTELLRRAEAGEDVVLTRRGQPVVRLVPVYAIQTPQARRALLEATRRSAAAGVRAGPGADRSQDFLYGEDGQPR